MRYGVPYMGSKNKIAKWVVDHLPPAETLVDIFAGGCAVTHAAMLSGKFKRFIINDLNSTPQVFIDAVNGEFEGYATVLTREEFHRLKTVDEAVAVLYSFGNNREQYLYGEDFEKVKIPAQKMLVAPSLRERRQAYKVFVKALADYLKNRGTNFSQRLESLQRLASLERLERLQGLQGLQGLQRLESLQVEYTDVDIPDNAIIYADPPYRGTDRRGYAHEKDFDYNAFADWLEQAPLTVISEYTCPRGCVEVASIEKRVLSCRGNKRLYNIERLFVHERHLQEYNERMRA